MSKLGESLIKFTDVIQSNRQAQQALRHKRLLQMSYIQADNMYLDFIREESHKFDRLIKQQIPIITRIDEKIKEASQLKETVANSRLSLAAKTEQISQIENENNRLANEIRTNSDEHSRLVLRLESELERGLKKIADLSNRLEILKQELKSDRKRNADCIDKEKQKQIESLNTVRALYQSKQQQQSKMDEKLQQLMADNTQLTKTKRELQEALQAPR